MPWTDPSPHVSRFVGTQGIQINYLDWGGSGTPLLLLHGIGDNPHAFDDLAPAFTDRFHVIAPARRGHGLSENKPPYDTETLTEDLRGFMDELRIPRAHLAGWSMGGNEITAMAGLYPERVVRLVYLDAAYDWSDPALLAAMKAFPTKLAPPASAFASRDAYRAWWQRWAPGVRDGTQIEAYLREQVIDLPDGTVKPRMDAGTSGALQAELMKDHKDYSRIRSKALAIFAEAFLDSESADPDHQGKVRSWQETHWTPFLRASIDRVERELKGVEVLRVPGTHNDFFFCSREIVASAMNRFLTV